MELNVVLIVILVVFVFVACRKENLVGDVSISGSQSSYVGLESGKQMGGDFLISADDRLRGVRVEQPRSVPMTDDVNLIRIGNPIRQIGISMKIINGMQQKYTVTDLLKMHYVMTNMITQGLQDIAKQQGINFSPEQIQERI